MRFQLINVLATLVIVPGLAAPTAKANGALDATNSNVQIRAAENTLRNAAVAEEFSLEKRADGRYEFVFGSPFRGAVHNVAGVALTLYANKGEIFVTIHNHLTQDIAAYIEEYTKNEDIMALTVQAGKRVEWTLHSALYKAGDTGIFSWKTNY